VIKNTIIIEDISISHKSVKSNQPSVHEENSGEEKGERRTQEDIILHYSLHAPMTF